MQLSFGSWAICVLALISSVAIALWKPKPEEGKPFWTFSGSHALTYMPMIKEWNAEHPPAEQFHGNVISSAALERRLASGLLSGTPVPDASGN